MANIINRGEEAITKSKGPCIILAGAGTGKTYTIVEKIKYLINNKIYSPEKIVCITFSNEAANNLLSRVRKSITLEIENDVTIKTFHSFSAQLLRENGNIIGIDPNFKILDPDESMILLHQNLKVLIGNCNKYISTIGTAKDLGITIEEVNEYLKNNLKGATQEQLSDKISTILFEIQLMKKWEDKGKKDIMFSEVQNMKQLLELKRFVTVWTAYEKIKQKQNYQDYSDLTLNALKLLNTFPEIAKNYDYIIVDEFQDTNKIQLEFLIQLTPHSNITVVGDINQSIYRFRGAYKENMHSFIERFKVNEKDIFALDKSYRSPNKVLKAAHKLILNNYKNPDECFAVENIHQREGDNIEVYELKDSKEEARKVAELIEKEVSSGTEPEEICVMFRTHQQGRIIKKVLESKNIEYCAVAKNSLLSQRSVKITIDYLNILNNLIKKEQNGLESWWDLIFQSGFDESDLIKVGRFIKDNEGGENIGAKLLSSLDKIGLSEFGNMLAKVLLERIKSLIPLASKEVPELVKDIYHIASVLNGGKTREDKEILLNLNKFHEFVKEQCSMHGPDLNTFLHYLGIIERLGIIIESPELESKGIRLMTLHSTKGLEYKTVIITNLAERRFPIERGTARTLIPLEIFPELKPQLQGRSNIEKEEYIKEYEMDNQILEERRLCYVAFTRAKERLILTYAKEYGKRYYSPSRFLEEVEYIKNPDFKLIIDNEERYQEPEIKIKPSVKLLTGIQVLDETNLQNFNKEHKQNIKEILTRRSFSPSSLLTFYECQKKFEYKYVYNMPEKRPPSWEEMIVGSFVHLVLEIGVKECFKTLKEFKDLAKEMQAEEEWNSVDLQEVIFLLRVFFERNKNKYNEESLTEQFLNMNLGGFKFVGFADRIDIYPDGIEIIDYKTGNSSVLAQNRNWQLGYYALAASKYGKVKKITLEMLRHENPLEFILDEEGNAKSIHSSRMSFNIYDIREELLKTANIILEACEKGFKPCPLDKHCEFCNEYIYNR
ncbi:MAG: ATP-dependent DNA helicase [Nanoarchaeota archaeon]|nr:ATP-dependent DNA helicase [Nanoarchaeota archaeon]